jgi:hypothetical protein
LRAADVSFEDHQDVLGHRSGRTTMHYSQSELTNLVEASEKARDLESRKNPRNRMNSSRSTGNSPLDNFGRARNLAFPRLLDTLASTWPFSRWMIFGTLLRTSARQLIDQEKYFLVRPDGFEPPTTWFEEAYSERPNVLENKRFSLSDCATDLAVIPC